MVTKNYGAGVGGYLDPEGRNYETTVYQASKPVLDTELNLVQDLAQHKNRQIRTGVPSGWLSPDVLDTSESVLPIYTSSSTANAYQFPALTALVNDWQILVRYTDSSTTDNVVDLGAGPAGVAAKRTDLVVLEVWRKLISASPDTDGKSLSGRIWRNGNVKIASADDATLNLTDEIQDANVGAETTKRVQIQYRVRVLQGVDIAAFPQGMDDPSVVANTVPPDAGTPDGAATAFTYANQSSAGDPGLWVAGDGNPANGMGTVDGYMYALPLCAVFRRNTNAFDRDNNHNGGVADPGPSDRPDGLFHDIIVARDILDLRSSVSWTGWDFQELMSKNVNFLFDNAIQTEHEITALGGGSQGHTNIWADEIGGIDNAGAELIRNFDAVSRRFSDRPILETVWVRYTPADQDTPGATWGDVLTIDPLALPIYPYTPQNLASVAPSDITIVAVEAGVTVGSTYVDPWGVWDDSYGPSGFTVQNSVLFDITGTGTVPMGDITIDTAGYVASDPMYIKLLISYPSGNGLTHTPTDDYGASSYVNELPANLPAAAPYNYDSLEDTSFDYPHREANLTYRTSDITWDSCLRFVNGPNDHAVLVPDRVASVTSLTETTAGTYTGPFVISADGYMVFIVNTDANWTGPSAPATNVLTELTYQAVRPIPINNCQFTVWYEQRAPQTVRDSLLGTTLQVTPRYVCPHLFCLVSGSGSIDEAYPYPYQYVQSPGVYPSSGGTFTGDHELDGSGEVWVSDFNADTGFLQIPTLIPAVPNPQSLVLERSPGDIDFEGRSFFKEVPAGYIPSAFGQPLSDPKKHKNCLPVICELTADGPIGPKGTLLLVMLSRWADFDVDNKVSFDPDLAANFTSASVYRLKGGPLANRR